MKKVLMIIIVVAVIVVAVIATRNKAEAPVATNPTVVQEQVPAGTTGTPEAAATTPQKTFTLAEVAQHAVDGDCYAAINGIVYDLTAWVHKHPGGDKNILRICGKDGSTAFNGQHGTDTKPKNILAGFEIGVLAQ